MNIENYSNTIIIIVAIITSFFGPILVILSNFWFIRLIKRKEIKRGIKIGEIDIAINEKLDKTLTYCGADKISIIKFHDGASFSTGLLMRKFSMVYEVVSPGFSSDLQITQSIPIEPFSQCFNMTREIGINIYKNIPDESALKCGNFACPTHSKISCNYRNFLLGRGVWSSYLFPLFDINDVFIGILQIEGVRRIILLNDEQIKKIKDICNSISGALSK